MRSVLVLAVSALLVAAAEPARSGPIMTCDLQSDCLQVIGATEAHDEIHSSLSWLQAGCSADGTQRKVCLSWSGGGSCDTNTSISHACATTYDPRESVKVDTFYETQYICQIIDNPGSIEVDVCHNEPVSCTDGSGCTALEPSGCTELCHECNHIHEFNTGYSGTPESGCNGLTGADLAKCNCLSTCVEHAYFGVKDGSDTAVAEPPQTFNINSGDAISEADGVVSEWSPIESTCEFIPKADCKVQDELLCYLCASGTDAPVQTDDSLAYPPGKETGAVCGQATGPAPDSIPADDPVNAPGVWTIGTGEEIQTCVAFKFPEVTSRRSLLGGKGTTATTPPPVQVTVNDAGFVDGEPETTVNGFSCGNTTTSGDFYDGVTLEGSTPAPSGRRLRRGLRTQPRRRLFEHDLTTDDAELCSLTGSIGERLWTIPTAPCVKGPEPDPCEGRFCDCDLDDLEFTSCINALEDDGCLTVEECCGVIRAYGTSTDGVACADKQAGYDLPYNGYGCGGDGEPPCVTLT